jgi:hypothetical protein
LVVVAVVVALILVSGFSVSWYLNNTPGGRTVTCGNSCGPSLKEENFAIIQVNFNSTALSFWIYNDGQNVFQPSQIAIYNASNSLYVIFYANNQDSPQSCAGSAADYVSPSLSSISIPSLGTQMVTLHLCQSTFRYGDTYSVHISGVHGDNQIYSQTYV